MLKSTVMLPSDRSRACAHCVPEKLLLGSSLSDMKNAPEGPPSLCHECVAKGFPSVPQFVPPIWKTTQLTCKYKEVLGFWAAPGAVLWVFLSEAPLDPSSAGAGCRCPMMQGNLQFICSEMRPSGRGRLQDHTPEIVQPDLPAPSRLALCLDLSQTSFVCVSLSYNELPVFLSTRHALLLAFGPET